MVIMEVDEEAQKRMDKKVPPADSTYVILRVRMPFRDINDVTLVSEDTDDHDDEWSLTIKDIWP